MVGQFLTGYLKRCGLEAEDVPKVAATFLGAKYCVWAASVALAVRYRPLRRVFLSRSKALFQGSASRPFAERKRLWLVDALDRLEHVKSSGRAAGSSRALTTRASLLKKLPSRVRKAVAAGIASARAQYRAANYSWKLAGWQLLRTQERQKLGVVPVKHRGITWYSWTSAKYWQLSDKLQASADSNRVWGAFTRSLGLGKLNSRGLALGLAEGTILFKFTVPIHMPLMLFTIVSFFRHRHWIVAETSPQDQKVAATLADAIEDARSNVWSTRAAAMDANSLVGWGWTWTVE